MATEQRTTRFREVIRATGGGGSYVPVPDTVRQELGATGRTSVTGTVNGFAIVGQVMPYSLPDVGKVVLLGLTKATRAAIGKDIGDEVEVELTRDDRSRSANFELPAELQAALDGNAAGKVAFEALAPSHRREYVRWIEEAKRPETRASRISKSLQKLGAG